MTVCIAGINRDSKKLSIVAVADQKVSFFGGLLSAEGVAMKVRHISDNWNVMFSGDLSPMVPLLAAITRAAHQIPPETPSVGALARACSAAYREERKRIIENEVLCDYDIDNYSEYIVLKTTNESLFEAITERISEKEQNWSLLFCGFGPKKQPHIFVIGARGKIQYCDIEGFAAIGSGAWAAAVSLSSYPYKMNLEISEAMYSILAAKYAAESADGVGKETVLVVFRPDQGAVPIMPSATIDSVREKWKNLPRIPRGAQTQLSVDLKEMESRQRRRERREKRKVAKDANKPTTAEGK